MPRKSASPDHVRALAQSHCVDSAQAAHTIVSILDGSWNGDAADRDAAILDAAKVLESAGCYVRRANAKGVL